VFAVFALLIGIFAALWFAAIANGTRHHAIARVKDDFAREREKIRVQSEKDKSKLIAQTHRETLKTIRRMQAGASFKVGVGFATLLGLGGILLVTQFVTIGLLTLSTAGGALLGYVVRARQEYTGRRQQATGERMFRRSGRSGIIEGQALPLTLDGAVEKQEETL
jgi:Flp pilus assembly protein TadB